MLSLVTVRRLLIRQIFTNTHRKFGTSNVKQSSLAPRYGIQNFLNPFCILGLRFLMFYIEHLTCS